MKTKKVIRTWCIKHQLHVKYISSLNNQRINLSAIHLFMKLVKLKKNGLNFNFLQLAVF